MAHVEVLLKEINRHSLEGSVRVDPWKLELVNVELTHVMHPMGLVEAPLDLLCPQIL